jgi:hypothetical protein
MTTTIAGTTVRPVFALLNTASVTGILREVSLWNTTNVACEYRLVRFTGGTAGAAQTESKYRRSAPPALLDARAGWTADATIDEDCGYRIYLGAGTGSAAILNFGELGEETHDVGATKGIGLVPVGTGQICSVTFAWDE